MIFKATATAATAVLLTLSAGSAMATSYVLTGDLTHLDFFDHGNGSFQLVVDTAAPISSNFTTVTGISGSFLGQNVTGISGWFGADNQFRNTSAPFTFNGMAFGINPLSGSFFTGENDNVASLYFEETSNRLFVVVGTTSFDQEWSGSYTVSNFTVSPVPEPATYGLMLAGLAVVAGMAKRRARQQRATEAVAV